MTEADVAALRVVYEKWARGDFWTPEIFDPEVETIWTSDFPDLEPAIGLDAMAASLKDYLSAWTDVSMTAEDFEVFGDNIFVTIRLSATGRTTGLTFEDRRAHVWTMRNGKATRIEGYLTVEAGRSALDIED
jgi:ketosteroid isomerase-like protein